MEYTPKLGLNSVQKNTENIVNIIKSDETEDVDIIVFPEMCINNAHSAIFIRQKPDLSPCEDKQMDSLIRDISCAAIQAQTYVVIDVAMKESNSELESDDSDVIVYNTVVVFDRNGFIIAKYLHIYSFSTFKLLKHSN